MPIIKLDCSIENIKTAIINLVKQNERCEVECPELTTKYMYKHNDNDNRCIVGHMMSVEEATELQKGINEQDLPASIRCLVINDHVELVNYEGCHRLDILDLLLNMQIVHDQHPTHDWQADFFDLLETHIEHLTN